MGLNIGVGRDMVRSLTTLPRWTPGPNWVWLKTMRWVLWAVLSACSGETVAPTPQQKAVPVDNPLGAQPRVTQLPEQTKIQLDLAGVRAAVNEWRQTHDGANPPNIGVLDLNLSIPGDMRYDPATGTVKSSAYPHL